METYHKIQTLFKRDDVTHKIIPGNWTLPEFEYLQNCLWYWTEKVDGTNIRVIPDQIADEVVIKGKTDNAMLPPELIANIQKLLPYNNMWKTFNLGTNIEREEDTKKICLYGEGYGQGIQKGGKYRKDKTFILFDIYIDGWWLLRNNIRDIAKSLGIDVVPLVHVCTINEAVEIVRNGYISQVSQETGTIAEGLVGIPAVPMFSRKGERIITKIKHKDFL